MEEEFIKNICKIGQGKETCRYLASSSNGWECLKLTDLKDLLDARVITNTIRAQGDNCKGVKNV